MFNAPFDPLTLLVAAVVAIIGAGRAVRVITYDDFPPSIKFRIWWDTITHDGPWSKLAHCLWCLSPYVMAFSVAWYIVSAIFVPWLYIAWWVFWAWLALSYLTSQYVYFDEGKPDAS